MNYERANVAAVAVDLQIVNCALVGFLFDRSNRHVVKVGVKIPPVEFTIPTELLRFDPQYISEKPGQLFPGERNCVEVVFVSNC